jgi:hypothetical protein
MLSVDYNPAVRVCDTPNTSAFECQTSPDYKVTVTETDTVWSFDGSVTSNSYPYTYSPCWTDDTDCQSGG